MPKESVLPPTPMSTTTVEGSEIVEWSRFYPVVGWQRDCDVQLGLQIENADMTLLDFIYGASENRQKIGESLHRWLFRGLGGEAPINTLTTQDFKTSDEQAAGYDALGKMVLEFVEQARGYVPERDGIWTDLTRQQINDLIRLLRKGRDQAYGRDE